MMTTLKKVAVCNKRTGLSKFLLSICVGLCVLIGCTKDKAPEAVDSFDLNTGLAVRLPATTVAFIEWDQSVNSYKKLAQSPWMPEKSISLDSFTRNDPSLNRFLTAVRNAGIAPEERKTWETLFHRSIAFVAAGNGKSQKMAGALYFEATPDAQISKKLTALKEEIIKAGIAVKDHKLSTGTGFVAEISDPPPQGEPTLVYVAWKENRGAIATQAWPLAELLGQTNNKLPKLVNTPQFQKSITGFPGNKTRIGFGYVDMALFIQNLSDEWKKQIQDASLDSMPVKSLAWASSMTNVPHNDFRLVFDASSADQKQWFAALGNSTPESVMAVLPEKPLLFTSIDGKTIARLKDIAVQQMQAANSGIQKRLSVLDQLRRVGFVIRMAPAGQALLPIPDLMIALESAAPGETKDLITQLGAELAAGAGTAPLAWTEKEIEGQAVQVMTSQFGIGAFVIATENLVVITSSEMLMKSFLLGSKPDSKRGVGDFPPRVQMALKEPTMSNFYVDFRELGALMEQMGGLLSMYAPQNQEAKTLFEPGNIEELKKMGVIVGTIKLENDVIGFKSFYHQTKKKTA